MYCIQGMDAFGLPAEQYAIQTGNNHQSQQKTTATPSDARSKNLDSAMTGIKKSIQDPKYLMDPMDFYQTLQHMLTKIFRKGTCF